ncbi:MAG: hypothetical protein LBB89_06925 [Treponema sp.]|jgi:hypothetical protein|nr:hypothetical protein [Treponema sp.]
MKTKIFCAVVIASLILLVSATVWEGVTDVVSKGDLPGNYSIATNSFPKNSVVDITNLENGKMVRAIVVSGLETRGLLATLSRNAANSIDLRSNSTCRIRITQPSDDIAFSRFKLGPIAAPPPSASEQNVVAENNVSESTDRDEARNYITIVESDSGADAAVVAYNRADYPVAAEAVTETAALTVIDETVQPVFDEKNTGIVAVQTAPETTTQTVAQAAEPAIKPVKQTAPAATRTRAAQAPAKAVTEITPKNTAKASVQPVAESAVQPVLAEVTVTMTGARPAEITPQDVVVQTFVQPVAETSAYTVAGPVAAAVENSPESGNAGNLGIIPSEERLPQAANRFVIAPENLAPPLKTNTTSPGSLSPGMSDFSPFQVPLISRLEQGKCYVQVAAYERVDHVEDEISRIGTTYPLTVQNIGSDANPMFRILLGPLNQGESGAMLQRFKSIGYNDAFIRYN